MPIVPLLTAIGSLLPQAVELFGGHNDKLERVADIASKALAKVPGYVEAVADLFGHNDGRKYTVADFDALMSRIDAEDQRSADLNKAAHDRG